MVIDDIQLNKPYLKKKAYISESKNKIYINLCDIKINNINKITNTSNALKLNIYINNNELNDIKNIEDNIYNYFSKYNDKWFKNNLTTDDLKDLFNYSFCSQTNTIQAILSNNSIINFNDNNININNKLYDLLKSNKYLINITLEHIGFYIFKYKLENKWIIKNINIIDHCTINDFLLNKDEIEKEWENTLYETIETLELQIEDYNNKIEKINNFISFNLDLINEIKNIKNNDKNWDNKINILKNNIKNILSINDNR